jgi:hypothetical protein
MLFRSSANRIRLIVLGAIVAIIIALQLWYIVPGLLAGKRLVGTPNSNSVYSTGGFHCPRDGPNRIHYHTCDGAGAPLPGGTKPTDFPDHN